MKWIILFLACLCLSTLRADKIENVEFNLPATKEKWKLIDQFQDPNKVKNAFLVYVPQNYSGENNGKLFMACVNELPSKAVDQAALENVYQLQYPDRKVSVTILQSDAGSVLYEWTAIKEGQTLYGLTRGFLMPQETILLLYRDENKSDADRLAWIEALKNARVVTPPVSIPSEVRGEAGKMEDS